MQSIHVTAEAAEKSPTRSCNVVAVRHFVMDRHG
jgi:hypothetical protein